MFVAFDLRQLSQVQFQDDFDKSVGWGVKDLNDKTQSSTYKRFTEELKTYNEETSSKITTSRTKQVTMITLLAIAIIACVGSIILQVAWPIFFIATPLAIAAIFTGYRAIHSNHLRVPPKPTYDSSKDLELRATRFEILQQLVRDTARAGFDTLVQSAYSHNDIIKYALLDGIIYPPNGPDFQGCTCSLPHLSPEAWEPIRPNFYQECSRLIQKARETNKLFLKYKNNLEERKEELIQQINAQDNKSIQSEKILRVNDEFKEIIMKTDSKWNTQKYEFQRQYTALLHRYKLLDRQNVFTLR